MVVGGATLRQFEHAESSAWYDSSTSIWFFLLLALPLLLRVLDVSVLSSGSQPWWLPVILNLPPVLCTAMWGYVLFIEFSNEYNAKCFQDPFGLALFVSLLFVAVSLVITFFLAAGLMSRWPTSNVGISRIRKSSLDAADCIRDSLPSVILAFLSIFFSISHLLAFALAFDDHFGKCGTGTYIGNWLQTREEAHGIVERNRSTDEEAKDSKNADGSVATGPDFGSNERSQGANSPAISSAPPLCAPYPFVGYRIRYPEGVTDPYVAFGNGVFRPAAKVSKPRYAEGNAKSLNQLISSLRASTGCRMIVAVLHSFPSSTEPIIGELSNASIAGSRADKVEEAVNQALDKIRSVDALQVPSGRRLTFIKSLRDPNLTPRGYANLEVELVVVEPSEDPATVNRLLSAFDQSALVTRVTEQVRVMYEAVAGEVRPRSDERIVGARPLMDYFYFMIYTITTTGYGDLIPVSPRAKFIVSLGNIVEVFFIVVFFNVLMNGVARPATTILHPIEESEPIRKVLSHQYDLGLLNFTLDIENLAANGFSAAARQYFSLALYRVNGDQLSLWQKTLIGPSQKVKSFEIARHEVSRCCVLFGVGGEGDRYLTQSIKTAAVEQADTQHWGVLWAGRSEVRSS